MGRRIWWATIHRVSKSQTRLKQLSMHHQAEEEFVTIFATCHFQELSSICGLSKLEACKLEGVPDVPREPPDEAGLMRKFKK